MSFNEEFYEFIKDLEVSPSGKNNGGYDKEMYGDSKNIPTINVGNAIVVKNWNEETEKMEYVIDSDYVNSTVNPDETITYSLTDTGEKYLTSDDIQEDGKTLNKIAIILNGDDVKDSDGNKLEEDDIDDLIDDIDMEVESEKKSKQWVEDEREKYVTRAKNKLSKKLDEGDLHGVIIK